MTRPRIICHMHTLLNGKVDGIANITSVGMRSQKIYFDLFLGEDRYYQKHRGWLSGSGTSEAIMGGPRDVNLAAPTEPVPAVTFFADPPAVLRYLPADSPGNLRR